jgi:hypothetical protein
MANSLATEAARRRAVAWAIAMAADTPLAPKRYELQLLARYEQGELTLDEVSQLLEASVYHVLYRSQATSFPSEAQLQDLLACSRTYNAQHAITGLLLYSDGQFMQLIEGPEQAIHTLFDRIRQDPRHEQVVTLSEGPQAQRWFTDWHMAFGYLEPVALTQMRGVIEAGRAPLLPFDDPHVQTLLEAFGLWQ